MSLLIGSATPAAKFDPSRAIRRQMIAGVAISALLVFGVGGWAAATEIAGAVIAPGRVIVESSVKKVQHPTGGVVGELLVREGQHVKAGDVLMRLDQTQTLAGPRHHPAGRRRIARAQGARRGRARRARGDRVSRRIARAPGRSPGGAG